MSGKILKKYSKALTKYLKGELSLKEIKKESETLQKSFGGDFPHAWDPVKFVYDFEEYSKKVQQQEKTKKAVWARLLRKFWDNFWFSCPYEASPWTEKILIYVSYGKGFVRDIESYPRGFIPQEQVAKIIEQKGWPVNHCDDYLLVLNAPQILSKMRSKETYRFPDTLNGKTQTAKR